MTEGGSSNFAFLEAVDDRLFRLATLAERYVFDDAPAALARVARRKSRLGQMISRL